MHFLLKNDFHPHVALLNFTGGSQERRLDRISSFALSESFIDIEWIQNLRAILFHGFPMLSPFSSFFQDMISLSSNQSVAKVVFLRVPVFSHAILGHVIVLTPHIKEIQLQKSELKSAKRCSLFNHPVICWRTRGPNLNVSKSKLYHSFLALHIHESS